MHIVILPDTHLQSPNHTLAQAFDRYMIKADLLLHCGDFTGEATWAFLASHPAFRAVRGNCDWELSHLTATLVIEFEGVRIGMAHGWGPRAFVGQTVAAALGSDLDLICYGHTHIRDWSVTGAGVRLLNPGSFSLPRQGKAGFAILEWEPDQAPEVRWIDI